MLEAERTRHQPCLLEGWDVTGDWSPGHADMQNLIACQLARDMCLNFQIPGFPYYDCSVPPTVYAVQPWVTSSQHCRNKITRPHTDIQDTQTRGVES